MEIKNSVGNGGILKGPDVGIIQKKINQQYRVNTQFKAALDKKIEIYKPGKALKVDNDCGTKTIDSIKLFQKIVLKWNNTDGKVDPGGATWKALNGNVANAQHIVKKSGKYVKLSQWEYPNTKIGNSTKYSIRQIGCTLTTLTMAATAIGNPTKHWPDNLLPKDLTPVKANDILKKSGAFANGGEMLVSSGASALGMTYKEFGRNSNLTSQDMTLLKDHLGKGYPVAAHVDYKDKDNTADDLGDHWILVVRANSDGSFAAIDPMFGGEIKLKATANQNARYKGDRAKEKTGVLFGYKSGQDKKAGPKTQRNQQKYIVVRFGLLTPVQNEPLITQMCIAPSQSYNSGVAGFSLESLILQN